MKGVVISGAGSGVGKTSITAGLLSKLSKSMNVQAYKVGPDFIDPMYHTLATGRPARNLDRFMMSEERIKNLVGFSSKDADICVIEGVRGLYEGLTGTSDECSTAEMAKILKLPVIIVMDARSLTRSAAAMVNGLKSFDPDTNIAGVIFNNVSGAQHRTKLKEAMERYTDVDVIGMIRRDAENTVGQRHLGLKTVSNKSELKPLESMVSELDVDRFLNVAESFETEDLPSGSPYIHQDTGIKLGVPLDDAYCFYYHENIECAERSGMRIKYFRPIAGDPLPDADAYYLGGGYPELHAEHISENTDFLEGLKNASLGGAPILGECGGLMTMCSSLKTADGRCHKMSGIFDSEARTSGRHGPAYTIADALKDNPLFSGNGIRGHEFHYSEVTQNPGSRFGFKILRGTGIDGINDGMMIRNSLGTYMHQHALSSDDWLEKIISTVK